MSYVVFNLWWSCSQKHKAHSKLEEANNCYIEFTKSYQGDIPVHPIYQKYVFMIAAINKNGNQRSFTEEEIEKAEFLNLDPKSLAIDIPQITSFNKLAILYFEASNQIPLSYINLNKIFDLQDENKHFWITDAGKGQALAYTQQSLFTLELSIKAYLEVQGMFASTKKDELKNLLTHEFKKLYNLIPDNEKSNLEKLWNNLDGERLYINESLEEFLKSYNEYYNKSRYISFPSYNNILVDINKTLKAAKVFVDASDEEFRKKSPVKFNFSINTNKNSVEKEDKISAISNIKGKVIDIIVSEGFDPCSIVEVLIDSEEFVYPIKAKFYKRNVHSYYGLESEEIELYGKITEDEDGLYILQNAYHPYDFKREKLYTSECLSLYGFIYDIKKIYIENSQIKKINLILYDKTFFTYVDCYFINDDEINVIEGFELGDNIIISGIITLLDGLSIVLVGPNSIEKVIENTNISKN